ncbi:MAG: hypothetical protein IJX62_04850 [Clostridia bacterium]|nr:hypothetical protein [Clostridia bacterium]
MAIRSTGEHAYFAASNSANGFRSYYSECFDADRVRRVYAVKGGPGTGKSRFLREVAACGEANGWSCEYIYCSSDPDSLDGMILSRGDACVALMDATAPHVYEPSHPGIREEIVNLGVFWSTERLTAHAEQITALNKEKSKAYRRAYRYLAGVGDMTRVRDELVAPFVRREKLRRFAQRLVKGSPDGKGFSSQPALIHSVGMRGRVGFDTYFAQADRIYRIEDCRGAGQYLMAELGNLAPGKKWKLRVSYDPIQPEKLDGLFLCDSGIAFVICPAEECGYPARQIDIRRLVDTAGLNSVRKELNYAEQMRRAMLAGAVEAMDAVKDAHFRIEELYVDAMDFAAKEKFTKKFCQQLFHLQNTD